MKKTILKTLINRRFSALEGRRRLLSTGVSVLLSISTFLTVIPQIETTVYAEDSKAIVLVNNGTASNISGAQTSSVYFGSYKQTLKDRDFLDEFNTDPIKWRVLENSLGKLFLLSDTNLDVQQYHNDNVRMTWKDCDLRKWMNGTFKSTAFSDKEAKAITLTDAPDPINTLCDSPDPSGGATRDYIFALSIEEIMNTAYGFPYGDDALDGYPGRVATNTAYIYIARRGIRGPREGQGDTYWLRSPGWEDFEAAATVGSTGYIDDNGDFVTSENAVRPALKVNLSSIIFTSAAKDGKISGTTGADSLNPVDSTTGVTEWKLTVHDESRDGEGKFTAGRIDDNTITPGKQLMITYSGAVTGSDKEYVSAIITNPEGTVLYYGHIASTQTSSSGTATINIPNGNNITDTCKLYVFQEQCNGNYKTDYSSQLHDLTAPGPGLKDISKATVSGIKNKTYTGKAIKQSPEVMLDGKTLNADTDYTVSYKNNKNVGTATVTITGKGDYTGTITKNFKINQAANKLNVKALKTTYNVSASKLKNKKQSINGSKIYKFTNKKKTKGTIKYTLSSVKKDKKKVSKGFSVNKSNGKLTINKGVAKGSYKITVKVTAGNKNYKTVKKNVKFTVKIK